MIYNKFRIQQRAPGIDYGYEYRDTYEGAQRLAERRRQEAAKKRESCDSLLRSHYPVPMIAVYGKDSMARYPGWVLLSVLSADGVWEVDQTALAQFDRKIQRLMDEIEEIKKTIADLTKSRSVV